MSVEVIVACMHQYDDSLYEKMNIQSDAVFANQCEKYSFQKYLKGENVLKIVSTHDRGVGKNRNMGLLNATGDILLFADEDMTFNEDYKEKIVNAFKELPKADAIIFNLSYSKDNVIYKTTNENTKRIRLINALKYGTSRIAIKRDSLLKANIFFSQLYGGGAIFSSGEDSLFIIDMLRKNLRIYTHEYVLGCTAKDTSSWFNGYNDKYYFDRGVWLANAFPTMKWVLSIYYTIKLRNTSEKSIADIYRLIIKGINHFDKEMLNL